jgi:peroxiredoxin
VSVASLRAASESILAADAASAHPLAAGAAAPDAAIKSPDGSSLTLASVLDEKPTLLVFYRGGWCPYCNRQLAELATFEPKFLALGFQIVALSTDAPAGLAPTAEKDKIAYRLFSDRAMSAASAYGVAYRVDAATVKAYRDYKIDLAAVPGEADARWLPVPTVFVIGRDRVIRFVSSNPDFKVRLPAAELLAAAQAAAGVPAK